MERLKILRTQSGGTGAGDLFNKIKIIKVDAEDDQTRELLFRFQAALSGMRPWTECNRVFLRLL